METMALREIQLREKKLLQTVEHQRAPQDTFSSVEQRI